MIDINKEYTRKGRTGTVVMVDRNFSGYPVVWVGCNGDIYSFTKDGGDLLGGPSLVEVKPTRWVNVYQKGVCGPYKSLELANRYAGPGRIACLEFEDGDGI